ncbi:unnamed protein product [Blepharisma stoltei]|uniref:Enoyl-CoA hydratase n=1 Tax=Blepharisma stoltei TaxID=1481888 RepID=A0AAU9IZ68_9CILI|nr:unnamed protein product [Blepharisma stoltei]
MALKRLSLLANHLNTEPKLATYQTTADKIAIITITRPSKLNAFSTAVWNDLNPLFRQAEDDPNVHVVILTGVGKSFAAGADVSEFQNKSTSSVIITNPIENWFTVLPRMKKPVIAAVNGLALGGGCEVAMMCDIIIASKTAKFGQPEIKLGLIPGAGGTQRLTRVVGKYKAMELILTGDMISADEAKEMGLVNKVVENALEEAIVIAKKIASYSVPVVGIAKKSINFALEVGLSAGLSHELALFNSGFSLQDKEEGISALLNKRKPNFTNK